MERAQEPESDLEKLAKLERIRQTSEELSLIAMGSEGIKDSLSDLEFLGLEFEKILGQVFTSRELVGAEFLLSENDEYPQSLDMQDSFDS